MGMFGARGPRRAAVAGVVAVVGVAGTAQAGRHDPGTPCGSGGPGHETPRGVFREWKHRDHHSAEFDGAPMPFAAFLAPGGIAFHEGSLTSSSAGGVRLVRDEAAAFLDFLQVGDRVEVV